MTDIPNEGYLRARREAGLEKRLPIEALKDDAILVIRQVRNRPETWEFIGYYRAEKDAEIIAKECTENDPYHDYIIILNDELIAEQWAKEWDGRIFKGAKSYIENYTKVGAGAAECDHRVYVDCTAKCYAPEAEPDKKETNPKDALGTLKTPMSVVPAQVLADIASGMYEGARKYGRHNYRVSGVRASVYYDAAMRHLMKWWEGEDIDPDSGCSHIVKAMTSLVVLRDAEHNHKLTDDRPPSSVPNGWMQAHDDSIKNLADKYPDSAKVFTRKNV